MEAAYASNEDNRACWRPEGAIGISFSRGLHVLRLLYYYRGSAFRVMFTWLRCMGVLTVVLLCNILVMYSYAVIGMELFGDRSNKAEFDQLDNCSSTEFYKLNNCALFDFYREHNCSSTEFYKLNNCASLLSLYKEYSALTNQQTDFSSFTGAMVLLFQIITTSNWQDIMFPNEDATSSWTLIYFYSFYTVCSILFIAVATGIILHAFRLLETRRRTEFELATHSGHTWKSSYFTFDRMEVRKLLFAA